MIRSERDAGAPAAAGDGSRCVERCGPGRPSLGKCSRGQHMSTIHPVTQAEFISATAGARIEQERDSEFWYERFFAPDGHEIGYTAYHCRKPATYNLLNDGNTTKRP
jgi:hypothetical protein